MRYFIRNIPKSRFTKLQEAAISGLAIVVTSTMAYRYAMYPGSLMAPVLLALIAALFIVWRPIVGIVIYLLVYPGVPQAESINLIKMSMLGLTLLILGIWFWQKIRIRDQVWTVPEYKWIYLFFLFLGLSPLLGKVNGFTVLDWSRDIASLLNLLIIPVLVDYFNERQFKWLLSLIFMPVGLGFLNAILDFCTYYGILRIPYVSISTFSPGPFLPSLIFALSVILYIQRPKLRLFWLMITCLIVFFVFLTPGRTIWVSIGFTISLLLFFFSRFRKTAIAMISVAIIAVAWNLLVPANPFETFKSHGQQSGYWQTQSTRLLGIKRKDVSILNRIDEFQQTYRLFIRSPIFGMGFGYTYTFWRHHVSGAGKSGFMQSNYTHNDLINIAAKGGIIGLVLFFTMLRMLLVKLIERKNQYWGTPHSVWPVLGIIAIYNSLFIGSSTPIYQSRPGMFMLTIFISLGLRKMEQENNDNKA